MHTIEQYRLRKRSINRDDIRCGWAIWGRPFTYGIALTARETFLQSMFSDNVTSNCLTLLAPYGSLRSSAPAVIDMKQERIL
jgi:hypothetical protein